MSEMIKITFSNEAEFLAHAIALKQESEERLEGLADCLEAHNNLLASEVFRTLAERIAENVNQLETQAANHSLPVVEPWAYQWHCADDPESLCIDQAHYLMTGREALELARFNEQRGMQFLERVVDEVDHPGVQQLALQMLSVEQEFAQMISQMLETLAEDSLPCEDFDPPNIPE